MALHGDLDTFGLADVLQLLSATSKTGCLRVEGDGGQGAVWVRDGLVTTASTDRVPEAPLDEIVCDLLRQRSGTYTFEVDERSPVVDQPEPAHELLDRAETLLAEWHELEEVVPSLDHRVGMVEHLPDGEQVVVTANQWHALVAVGQGCTVAELAGTLGLTELHALRTVNGLVAAGLATVGDVRPALAGQARRRARARMG